jgi:hypothetical protein
MGVVSTVLHVSADNLLSMPGFAVCVNDRPKIFVERRAKEGRRRGFEVAKKRRIKFLTASGVSLSLGYQEAKTWRIR